jgi:hypothetical protein
MTILILKAMFTLSAVKIIFENYKQLTVMDLYLLQSLWGQVRSGSIYLWKIDEFVKWDSSWQYLTNLS